MDHDHCAPPSEKQNANARVEVPLVPRAKSIALRNLFWESCSRFLWAESKWSDAPAVVRAQWRREGVLESIGCDDIARMVIALDQWELAMMSPNRRESFPLANLECGDSATVFRFLSMGTAAMLGVGQSVELRGSPSLLSRPHEDVSLGLLHWFGCEFQKINDTTVLINKKQIISGVLPTVFPARKTSQVASALLLVRCAQLDTQEYFDFALAPDAASVDFFALTMRQLESWGFEMTRDPSGHLTRVKRHSLSADGCLDEPDAGAAVALSCFLLSDDTSSKNSEYSMFFPGLLETSPQPDIRGFDWLRDWGLRWEAGIVDGTSGLRVHRSACSWPRSQVYEADLRGAPDLFPIMAATALSCGITVRWVNTEILRHKETDRGGEVCELVGRAGIGSVQQTKDSIIISPLDLKKLNFQTSIPWDVSRDHRLAMAGERLRWGGVPIQLLGWRSVKKSFPSFFQELMRCTRGEHWALAPHVFVIGHRGTGKSSWVAALVEAGVVGPEQFVDLDAAIEETCKHSVSEIFAKQGEAAFRSLELQMASELLSSLRPKIVVLGAGFCLEKWEFYQDPRTVVLWCSRVSDGFGRIFIDHTRPRLLPHTSALEESKKLTNERSPVYERTYDWVLDREEGFFQPPWSEQVFFHTLLMSVWPKDCVHWQNNDLRQNLLLKRAMILIQPKMVTRWIRNPFAAEAWWESLCGLGLSIIEVRDDVELPPGFKKFISLLVHKFSIRLRLSLRRYWIPDPQLAAMALEIDIDLGLTHSSPDDVLINIFQKQQNHVFLWSSHSHEPPWRSLPYGEQSDAPVQMKWAPQIDSYQQLLECLRQIQEFEEHQSQQVGEELSRRIIDFYPRSSNGQFRWLRLCGEFARMSFVQEQASFFVPECPGVPDQPSLLEWMRREEHPKQVAISAILGGDPSLSWTPGFHASTQKESGAFVTRVPCSEIEWGDCMRILQNLSNPVRFLAVTSPVKSSATQWASASEALSIHCKDGSETIRKFSSHPERNSLIINSIYWPEARGAVFAGSTDAYGMRAIAPQGRVVVFGRGDLAPVWDEWVERHRLDHLVQVPDVTTVSFRDWSAQGFPKIFADVLIVVAPSGRSGTEGHPSEWTLFFEVRHQIIDLSYREDSWARELALQLGVSYKSGADFFHAQARAQIMWMNQVNSLIKNIEV